MKISQMNSEQGADVLMKIMKPVCDILADRDAVTLFDNLQGLDPDQAMEGLTAVVMQALPYLLEKHRMDTFAIIGALSGKTAQQIASQRFLETVRDVIDCADRELIDFFTSFSPQVQSSEGE